MGTNYYARYSPCKSCGRCSSEKHIGKSSHGWKFLFQVHEGIYCWRDWKKELHGLGVEIWNEYNERITFQQLEEIVARKQMDTNQLHVDQECWFVDEEGYDFSRQEFS